VCYFLNLSIKLFVKLSRRFSFQKYDAFDMWSHREQIGSYALHGLEGWCSSLLFYRVAEVFHVSDLGEGVARDVDKSI
jgi:hypothetical protein